MKEHSSRAHSTWSASSTARNWACPGALALSEHAPPDRESPAAAYGTACHQLSETILKNPALVLDDFLGTTIKTKEMDIEVDAEMIETAGRYVEHVRSCAAYPNASLWLEEEFSLEAIKPPFDAGGTCDAVVYVPEMRHLRVIDLKGGKGVVVEVEGNPQLRTYALGAMLAHPKLDIETITVTIVQPRAPHKDGRIRSETFHTSDLIDWTADLIAAMQVAKRAMDDFKIMPRGAWWNAYLNAGAHCKFCRAAAICPKREQFVFDEVGVHFDDLDNPRISNEPQQMDGEALAKKLDLLDMIEDWCNAIRAYAHAQAENGVTIPGYQLSEKISNRRWKDEQEAFDFLNMFFGVDDLYTRKIISPAQAERLLGAKQKSAIAPFVTRVVTGVNLVKASKSTRPAVGPKAERMFEPLED